MQSIDSLITLYKLNARLGAGWVATGFLIGLVAALVTQNRFWWVWGFMILAGFGLALWSTVYLTDQRVQTFSTQQMLISIWGGLIVSLLGIALFIALFSVAYWLLPRLLSIDLILLLATPIWTFAGTLVVALMSLWQMRRMTPRARTKG